MTTVEADDATATQLALVGEIAAILGEACIRFWLRGGWALDFHLGRITRPHADVDLVTWRRHRDRIRRLLEPRGFAPVPSEFPEAQLVLEKHGQEIGFVFIVRGPDGTVVTPGFGEWPWLGGAFGERRRTSAASPAGR